MRSKLLIFLLFIFSSSVFASEKNLNITAQKISFDKNNETTIFEGKVVFKDEKNNLLKGNYGAYNNKKKILEFKGAVYIKTTEGYLVNSSDVIFDRKSNIISSNKDSSITDFQKNIINLKNFEYNANKNIFKSIGKVEIIDVFKNSYQFSQIYIDEKKKELIGTDSKTYFNQLDFKSDPKNKPRIFSNSVSIGNKESTFIKGAFTMCDYRENDKCPPWELTAKKIRHDNVKKTIYYDNAVIKIYDVPIFYFPKLTHPDPTVDRRSGFLIPSFTDTKNLGSGINLPYYWAINKDKDLTINNKLFVSENPLFLGEYRQAFKDSNLILDFGYTEGYKNNSTLKKSGDKSHFFSKFVKNFKSKDSESKFEINLQEVSNKKYLKLYRIESSLLDNYETNTLTNFINFNHYNDEENLFFDFNASVYRDLRESFNDKYEYILPDININKILYSDKYGDGNFNSNLKIHNYDTNKYEKYFVNDFNWSFEKSLLNFPHNGKLLTSLKNVNYESKNVKKLKKDTTSEIFGALGYLASIDLIKKEVGEINHFLKPKLLVKYSPNHMKKETNEHSLQEKDIFSLDRLNTATNFESGTSLTYGFDYERLGNSKLNFSIGQIINEKKNNKNMPDTSTLDKRFSDVVGSLNFTDKKNFKLDYNFSLDQNLKELNYNEVSANYTINNIKFNLDYLEEGGLKDKKEYVKSSIEIKNGTNGLFSFNNKRNIVTNSSEYYNLSYEYLNDCLRAGLVYRREFYQDSELEPENSLLFKITLVPFGSLSSPQISQ